MLGHLIYAWQLGFRLSHRHAPAQPPHSLSELAAFARAQRRRRTFRWTPF